jgi:hypothetical protein
MNIQIETVLISMLVGSVAGDRKRELLLTKAIELKIEHKKKLLEWTKEPHCSQA